MQKKLIIMLIVSSIGLTVDAVADAQQDLKIKNLEIYPNPEGLTSPNIKLHASRSYRFIVTVLKNIALQESSTFIVRTECLRDGNKLIIGENRVGDSKGWHIYATYDVFPGEVGVGNCLLRTTVDANNEVQESDESPLSNVWDRSVIIVP